MDTRLQDFSLASWLDWITWCLHERLTIRRAAFTRQWIRITMAPDALNYNDRQDIR